MKLPFFTRKDCWCDASTQALRHLGREELVGDALGSPALNGQRLQVLHIGKADG